MLFDSRVSDVQNICATLYFCHKQVLKLDVYQQVAMTIAIYEPQVGKCSCYFRLARSVLHIGRYLGHVGVRYHERRHNIVVKLSIVSVVVADTTDRNLQSS